MQKIFPDIKLGKYQEEKLDISVSAFEVFKRLYSGYKNVFLLESLGEEGKYNRFSYVGFSPAFIISANNREIYIDGRSYSSSNAFEMLVDFFQHLPRPTLDEGYRGGLVGYISHEGTRYFEKTFSGFSNRDYPCFHFGFYQDGLIFDKKGKSCVYFHYGQSRLKEIRKFINSPGSLGKFHFRKLEKSDQEDIHREMVNKAKERIRAGNIFQVVLSLKSHYAVSGDYRRVYAVLRQVNPSPYMIYQKFGDREIISASPELLIGVKGQKITHLGTLAGTIRRGENFAQDKELAKQLKKDGKEMAEHMMLVDLARNDLGRICEFGSIKVEKLAIVKTYSFVQHLYSEVTGKLRDDQDAFSALKACFPAGTLSGAPKIEAMKIIKELEGSPRGPYGGVGGYVSLNGESMFAILIRSLFIKGQSAFTQTGSGIVLDSTPEKEYQEVINKQKAMEETLKLAQGKSINDETMKP